MVLMVFLCHLGLLADEEISRLIKAMAIDGRGIFMLTKSNDTEIKDIIQVIRKC